MQSRDRKVGGWLPSGHALPTPVWEARHRGIVWFLWAHLPVLFLVGVFSHHSALHSLLDLQPVILAAVCASCSTFRRGLRSGVATFGLVACSAILVHFSGGVIEMHFHFFVVVGVVTLYQDWTPFVVAIAFTVLEHGVVGVISPRSVYDHHAAQANPWLWAAIHGAFVLAASVPHILAWRQSEDQAFRDPLTRLSNRALLTERLHTALARANGRDAIVGVLFVDLDHFKQVNDTLGHAAGDELLIACAARLSNCMRASDVVARFGGDEFTLILEHTDPARADELAGRVLAALSEPLVVAGHEIVMTASIGVAVSTDKSDPAELLRNADLAMYVAKSTGRNRYERYHHGMHEQAIDQMQLENDLRNAVANGELTIACQPIVAIDTGVAMGAEVLARWLHPERGPIPPAVFIPLAERTGLVTLLGEQVLTKACALAQEFAAIDPSLTVTVNVSPIQLGDASLPATVRRLIDEYDVEPSRLVLEVTETVLMQDLAVAAERLTQLKRLGVRIAVDDFGVGHSSLSYLRNLPVDVLKIDKSFVDDLPAGRDVAQVMIQLGSMLGLDVVAEGVESPQQRLELQALGCGRAQGFLFAKPMAPSALLDQLAAARGRQPITPVRQ